MFRRKLNNIQLGTVIALKEIAAYDEPRFFLEGMMPQSDSVFGPVTTDLKHGRYSSAMMKLTKISNEFSKNPEFLSLLGQTQRALGDFAGLIKTLQVTCKLEGSAISSLQLMLALYEQGRLNEALDVGLELQERGLTGGALGDLHECLVRIYLEFSDFEGIKEILNQIEEVDDFMSWAKGLVCLADGNKGEALNCFRDAVGLNSDNDQAWVSLAVLHDEMGDRELALANLERALELNPHNATGIKLMAQLHPRNPEQAEHVLNKISYYLAQHEFDEEISLCYVQVLQENRAFTGAGFELEKLILRDPSNDRYRELKKNLLDTMNL